VFGCIVNPKIVKMVGVWVKKGNVPTAVMAESFVGWNQQIDSDRLEGVTRNPFAFYFPIQRGFSGPIQTLRFRIPALGGPSE